MIQLWSKNFPQFTKTTKFPKTSLYYHANRSESCTLVQWCFELSAKVFTMTVLMLNSYMSILNILSLAC